ncbi:glutaredoxin family protein [Camelliibacillus cellulosilyticus]|uniref:Glutaredoxin family protein n=1 Tax=Camelliibacillus cellulosilyticus TaxID=2174486 RepID=A0ABV9GM11_9BACL
MKNNHPDIVLYTRSQCPLCDEAKAVLDLVAAELGIAYREIDIHTDDALLEKYQLMIPVVEINGRLAAFGQVTFAQLIEYLPL